VELRERMGGAVVPAVSVLAAVRVERRDGVDWKDALPPPPPLPPPCALTLARALAVLATLPAALALKVLEAVGKDEGGAVPLARAVELSVGE
jgi:hypothetical protein